MVLSHRLTFGAKNVSACALWCRSSIWLELCPKLKLLRARASCAMARPTSTNSSSSKVAPRASGAGQGAGTDAELAVIHKGKTRVAEVAIPWDEIPGVKGLMVAASLSVEVSKVKTLPLTLATLPV